jgi:hypothetical protein
LCNSLRSAAIAGGFDQEDADSRRRDDVEFYSTDAIGRYLAVYYSPRMAAVR